MEQRGNHFDEGIVAQVEKNESSSVKSMLSAMNGISISIADDFTNQSSPSINVAHKLKVFDCYLKQLLT